MSLWRNWIILAIVPAAISAGPLRLSTEQKSAAVPRLSRDDIGPLEVIDHDGRKKLALAIPVPLFATVTERDIENPSSDYLVGMSIPASQVDNFFCFYEGVYWNRRSSRHRLYGTGIRDERRGTHSPQSFWQLEKPEQRMEILFMPHHLVVSIHSPVRGNLDETRDANTTVNVRVVVLADNR